MNITHSNRTSYHQRRYPLDQYGIQSSALPPHIRKVINELKELDQQVMDKRTELNKAAELWLRNEGLSFFFDLDEPTGPIAFTKRQGYKPELEEEKSAHTLISHTRIPGTVTKIINNILKLNQQQEPKSEPKPKKPIKLVASSNHRIAKGYDKRNNIYGI